MAQAVELPAGQLLEVRLRNRLQSYSAQEGQHVEAILAAPLIVEGNIAAPAGSVLTGSVGKVRRVGLGLVHERARVSIEFNRLEVAGGATVTVKTRLFQIENAREKLDAQGRVEGIRSTNTPGFRATGVLTSLAAVDPIALLFSTAAFTSTLRFSDPEIDWRPGAELVVELLESIDTGYSKPIQAAPVAKDAHERAELVSLTKSLPYRTARVSDGIDSDLTNVMMIGKPDSIARAFRAAGWVESMPSTPNTMYRSLRAFAESQPYQEAPMSALSLDGDEAVLTLSKTLNTFTRRHHLRLYAWKQSWDGLPVFQAAATHDTDIVMSLRKRRVTHKIDAAIDQERAKVVNDLMFTGCVEGSEWVARTWIEKSLRNGTGQDIQTDRAIAVLRFNDCESPADGGIHPNVEPTFRGNIVERGARQAILRFRNDVLRGNLAWQTTSWAYKFSQMLRKDKKVLAAKYERRTILGEVPESSGIGIEASNEDGSSMIAPLDVKTVRIKPDATLGGKQDWGTPSVELGFSFGTSLGRRSTVGEEAWIVSKHRTSDGMLTNLALTAGNQIRPGWAIGGSVTVHVNRWFSNELRFQYLRGSYMLGLQRVGEGTSESIPGLVEQRAGLLTRQVSYNTVFHLKPLESRWRPYIAAGPALQLVHLTDAPFQGTKGIYRLGLSNVGILRSAYNFNKTAPLDGGGIFQPAIQVGGGLKYRYRSCWMLRLDYRNTISQRPDMLRKSLALAPLVADIQPIQNVRTQQWLNQQRLSVGLSFTF